MTTGVALHVVRVWNTSKKRDEDVLELMADPEVSAAVTAEITRLEASRGPHERQLLHPDRGDEVSRRMYTALTAVRDFVAQAPIDPE